MNIKVAVGMTALVTFSAGLVTGFLVAKSRLEKIYAEQLKDEIESTKAFYAKTYKKDTFETPEAAAEALIPKAAAEALLAYQGNQEPTPKVDYRSVSTKGEEVVKNVFAAETSVNIEREIANRTEEAPYIISFDEFKENEYEFTQNTLTYYSGDGVLCDERDDVIEEIDVVVGDNNISRFGHRSNDPNIVYVRNHVLEVEMEIIQDARRYGEVVAGFVKE